MDGNKARGGNLKVSMEISERQKLIKEALFIRNLSGLLLLVSAIIMTFLLSYHYTFKMIINSPIGILFLVLVGALVVEILGLSFYAYDNFSRHPAQYKKHLEQEKADLKLRQKVERKAKQLQLEYRSQPFHSYLFVIPTMASYLIISILLMLIPAFTGSMSLINTIILTAGFLLFFSWFFVLMWLTDKYDMTNKAEKMFKRLKNGTESKN